MLRFNENKLVILILTKTIPLIVAITEIFMFPKYVTLLEKVEHQLKMKTKELNSFT